MKRLYALLFILAAGCTLLGFSAYWLGYNSYEPKTITEYVEVPSKPVYIVSISPPEVKEVIKEVPEYRVFVVNNTVEKPVEQKEWVSIARYSTTKAKLYQAIW